MSQVRRRIRITPDDSLRLDVRELVHYRELLLTFVSRDVMVRYKQTILGLLWVIIQPLVIMVIFTVIFGHVAKLPSDGVAYSIFFYSALLPWNLFSEGTTRAATSMVANSNLISKIYFPRVIIPLAGNVSPLIDFCVAFLILIGLMLYHSVEFTWNMLFIPIIIAFILFLTAGIGMWVCSLNVKYRDIQYAIPFGLQVLFYMSPIVYSGASIPAEYAFLFSLNPMNVVITSFRWVIYGAAPPSIAAIGIALLVTIGIFISGFMYFKATEKYFADVI